MTDTARIQAYGPYVADAVIGKGSMGVVYRGHDTVRDRRVAIKVLAPQGAAGRISRSDLLERFKREAGAYDKLTHPSIVALYDLGVTADNRPYLVMELVDGVNLEARLRADGVLEPAVVARVGTQIARALQHAHDAGFIHRDVKPANIILTRDGAAKLMDFGIARTTMSSLTADGTFVGSLQFASPEQVSAQAIDGRSDLFSLSVTLYVLVTGRHPFARDTMRAMIQAISGDDAPAPSWLRAELPATWDAFFARALAKEADGRFQSGSEMAEALVLLDHDTATRGDDAEYDVVFLAGPDQGRRFPLAGSATIGRGDDGAIRVSDPRVSGRHCVVELMDHRPVVRDVGSRNGTWVDGKRVDRAQLTPANKVHLGPDTVLQVVPRGKAAEADDPAVLDTGTCIMPGAIDHVLVVLEGPRQGTRFVLGGSLLLGNGTAVKGGLDDSDADDEHAIIEVRDDGVYVRDLESSSGTWLDGLPVKVERMSPGQKLRIGQTELVLRRAESV